MPSALLFEWMGFSELEPFGPLRDDLRAGVIGSFIANCAFGRAKGAKLVRPEDIFKSLPHAPTKPQTGEQMATTARAFTKALGGLILKKGERPPGKGKPAKKKPKK